MTNLYKDVPVKEIITSNEIVNQKVKISTMNLLAPIEQSYRIDKNMPYNTEVFSSDDEVNVIKSLILYFSYSYQTNFFGFGSFDPHDFAKVMDYKIKGLFKKAKNPIQFKGLSDIEIEKLKEQERKNPEKRIYDSILENALYFLLEPIKLERGGKLAYFKDGYRYYSEVVSFQYLKSIACQFGRGKGNKGKDKILYHYSLTPELLSNINGFYLKTDIKSHIALRKQGLDDFYFYLKNVQNSYQAKLESKIFLNFDDCVKKARISLYYNQKTNTYNKAEQKRALIKALNDVKAKSDLKFDFEFVKGGNSRWAYVPCLTFNNDIHTQKQLEEHHIQEKRTISHQLLAHELREMFEYIFPNKFYHKDRVENFFDWLKSDANEKEKIHAYNNASLKAHGSLKNYHETYRNRFFQSLKNSNSLEDIFFSIPTPINKSLDQTNITIQKPNLK